MRAITALLLVSTLGCAAISGGEPEKPQPARAASAGPGGGERNGLKPFAELTKGTTARTGFFDTYEKPGHLYLAVPKDRLGKEFLLAFEIAQGIGANGLFGGTMLDIFEGSVVALERHGDHIYLVKRPLRFTAPEGSPERKAVELSFGSSVLESAKIASVRDDSAAVIDIHDWLVSDLSNVGQRVNRAVSTRPGQPGRASLDRERSYLEAVKAFPRNLNLRAKLTFKPSDPPGIGSVPDDRYIPLSIHYTFAELPAEPMTPRQADDRVGYFLTVRKDFSQDEESFFVRYVNRWRLEPGERVGDLHRPKEPIVYYLDPNIPEEYRGPIAAGVEAWARAFEAAGFKDAIRAEPLPEGADPEDLRYATIRWNTSDRPGYGAIGPSIVDPRSGEILDADILIEANMVLGFKRDWRTMVRPGTAVEEMLFAAPDELAFAAAGGEMATLGAELAAQGSLLRAVLAARGEIGPEEAVPAEYVAQALRWVTMHEVGHTLGLRHNFRSSADTPLEKLYDPAWAEERGVFSSVMEYPTVNLAPEGPTPYHYNPSVGSYDRWAIAYGYTPDPARAEELARQAALPGHAYGTDEDARGPGALDPTVNVYDLGADPLAWGKSRAELIAGLWAGLPEHVLADNARYARLTDAFRTLLSQYGRALAAGVKYVGGQYQYRDHVGDPQARPPFVPVERERQREALAFLTDYAFDEDAFAVPAEVLASLGANRWSHWGETNTFDGRIDYPFHEEVLDLQRDLLEALTQPFLFARIRDAERKFGAEKVLTIPELLETLTRSVWSEAWSGGGRNVPAIRRDLQRAYLDRLGVVVATPPSRMPADARAVARARLHDLDGRIARALRAGGLDAYTRAHLAESRARIEKILEAGLEVELGSTRGR